MAFPFYPSETTIRWRFRLGMAWVVVALFAGLRTIIPDWGMRCRATNWLIFIPLAVGFVLTSQYVAQYRADRPGEIVKPDRTTYPTIDSSRETRIGLVITAVWLVVMEVLIRLVHWLACE